MCNAQTALTLQAASGAYKTVGSYFAAGAEKSAYKAQAGLAGTNAKLAEINAQLSIREGQFREQQSRLKTAQVKGSQRAAMAANGIDIGGSTTALALLTSTDVMGEVEANSIAANAAREAWGYRTQAVNAQNEAIMRRATAKSINPWMSGATTLLTDATSVGSNIMQYKKEGYLSQDAFSW